MTWSTVLGSGFGAAVIWGIVVVIKLRMQQPITDAEAAGRLSDHALAMVQQAVDSAERAEARAEKASTDAERSRQEAAEARREATDARREAMDAMREFRRLKAAILSPYATLEVLREMVAEPGNNGTGSAHVIQ